jgi:hypothetical protein
VQGRPTGSTAGQVYVTVLLRDDKKGNVVMEPTVFVGPAGTFTVSGVPAGFYNVNVKFALSVSRTEFSVAVYNGLITQVDFGTLPAGDADDNDVTDIRDFSHLRASFGRFASCGAVKAPTTPCADFNGDGVINVVDFSILRSSFGQRGDPSDPGFALTHGQTG